MGSEHHPLDLPSAAVRPGALGHRLRQRAAQARQRFPGLWLGGWAVLALTLPLLWLGWTDPRTIDGVSVWTKPWKFHLSVGVHLLTLAWLATYLSDTPARAHALRRLTAVALACAVFELAYITWRAAHGEPSHFNVATPFAGAMYTLMGLGAVLLTGCAGMLGLWIARATDFAHGPVLQRGLALGLLLGWALGTLTGAYVSAQTGHGVGGTPGAAAGLPIVQWARDGGDLRVAHFFGLHAMQALPLVGWAAAHLRATRTGLHITHASAAACVALTAFTFIQALRGQPFI
jgi:hypothetical protein